jgi:hypothetical protein
MLGAQFWPDYSKRNGGPRTVRPPFPSGLTTTTMHQVTPIALASWQNFYVLVGSSAGALTGLQFVVMTLVTQARAASNVRDIRAFGTPTVIHFCTALLISAVMTAPWNALASLGLCLAACGAVGVAPHHLARPQSSVSARSSGLDLVRRRSAFRAFGLAGRCRPDLVKRTVVPRHRCR